MRSILGSVAVCGALLAGAASAQSITTDNSGASGQEHELAPPASEPNGPATVLYSQLDDPAPVPGGVTSQNFGSGFENFVAQAADDFVVTLPGWVIQGVEVAGEYSVGGGPANGFNVFFYADSGGLPGAQIASRLTQPFSGGANAAITLSPAVELEAGTYWVSVQADQTFDAAGQWFWDNRLSIAGDSAAWRNPGDGFGTGCTAFGVKTDCLPTQNGPDQLFRLSGRYQGGSLQVLIVYADSSGPPASLRSAILAELGVTTVDLFDALSGTPSLGVLQAYDVVVPFSNTPFSDSTTLGNNLADYADGGGKVVQFGFSFYGPAQPYGVNGRWASGGYSPYTYTTNILFSAFTLQSYVHGHPLFAGVSELASDFQNVVTPAAGALNLATASTGNSLVAQRDLPANQTVGVTAYVGVVATWSGQFSRIVVNAGHLLFVDGFENNSLSRWTSHVP